MLSRAEMTLAEVQCHLDRQGASNLVVELIIQNPTQNIFLMSVELGIALLEGGNPMIQKSMFAKLKDDNNSEKFFKIFYQKMISAQQEIKSTVTVSTSELNEVNGPAIPAGDGGEVRARLFRSSFRSRRPSSMVTSDELKREVRDICNAARAVCSTNVL